jgi:eukaryotic-like serine/threonine-protein kinase
MQFQIVHHCDHCGRVVLRKQACTSCGSAERALASAARSESIIRAVLYPPAEFVEVRPLVGRSPASAHVRRVAAGTIVAGRYELLEELGSGGTATVFRAHDRLRGADVAVKLLHQRLTEDHVTVEQFRQEACHAARLQHPNIVRSCERGESGGLHFIVMEHVRGRSLSARLAFNRPLEAAHAIEIVLQILEATGFTHDEGVVHCDLTPGNVIVDPRGQVKVIDFGIARTRTAAMRPTASLMGTVEYMSPERLSGDPGSEACDIYSVGVILYELVTGRPPFGGELVSTVARRHAEERPIPPSAINPSIAPGLDAIIMRALEKAPDARYPSAREFAAALRREAGTRKPTVALATAA